MSNLPMDPTFALLARQPRKILRDANAAREAVFAARRETRPYSNLDLQIEDHHVPLANEEKTQILVRIYRGKNTTGTLPVLLYLHGGGFYCGDHLSEELQCAQYAVNAQCAVVSVAYRLAPEEPFPAALTDCYRVLEFLWDESLNLNLDRDFIAVGGSSAGANLAAAVALLARDRTGPKICFQMLKQSWKLSGCMGCRRCFNERFRAKTISLLNPA
jgi:acetyl esterase